MFSGASSCSFGFGVRSMTIGNLDDLAAMPGMPCRSTLQRLILRRPDFPFLVRGGPGRAHRIDLEEAARFVRAARSHPPIDPEKRRAAIRALGLVFLAEIEAQGDLEEKYDE